MALYRNLQQPRETWHLASYLKIFSSMYSATGLTWQLMGLWTLPRQAFPVISPWFHPVFFRTVQSVWTRFSPWSCWLLVFVFSAWETQTKCVVSVCPFFAWRPCPFCLSVRLCSLWCFCLAVFRGFCLARVWSSAVLRLGLLLLYRCFGTPFRGTIGLPLGSCHVMTCHVFRFLHKSALLSWAGRVCVWNSKCRAAPRH